MLVRMMKDEELSPAGAAVHAWKYRKLVRALFILSVALLAGCTALKQCAYEGFNRDEWQHPERVIASLDLEQGQHVADLGSGSGYFTFRLAEAVGRTGKVYAVDVDPEMNEVVTQRAKDGGFDNIEVILAKYDDPSLPESGVDLIFSSNTYHHLEDRVAYFARAAKYLRPNGRVAIIDFNGEGWLHKLLPHWTAAVVIEGEMKEAGYSLDRRYDFLPKQHFLIFSAGTP